MKIYHVTRKPKFKVSGFGDRALAEAVVVAEGPSQARALCRDEASNHGADADLWLRSENTKCEHIGYTHRWKNSAQVISYRTVSVD